MPEDYPTAFSTPPIDPTPQAPTPNQSQKKPSKTVLILLTAALSFSLAAFGYTLWRYQNFKESKATIPPSTPEEKKETQTPDTSTALGDFIRSRNAAANVVLGDLRDVINVGSEISTQPDPDKALQYKARRPTQEPMSWKTEDGWTISIYNASSIVIPVPIEESWKQQGKHSYLHPFSEKAISTISQYLQSKDFEPSEQNNHIPQAEFEDYKLGLENKNTGVKCVFSIGPGYDTDVLAKIDVFDIETTCVDSFIFDENYQEQIVFLNAIGNKDLVIWGVMRKKGEFAYLSVGQTGGGGGYYIIGKLSGDEWTEVVTGQDLQECKLMEENGVPEQVYGNCYYCDQDQCQPKYPF